MGAGVRLPTQIRSGSARFQATCPLLAAPWCRLLSDQLLHTKLRPARRLSKEQPPPAAGSGPGPTSSAAVAPSAASGRPRFSPCFVFHDLERLEVSRVSLTGAFSAVSVTVTPGLRVWKPPQQAVPCSSHHLGDVQSPLGPRRGLLTSTARSAQHTVSRLLRHKVAVFACGARSLDSSPRV